MRVQSYLVLPPLFGGRGANAIHAQLHRNRGSHSKFLFFNCVFVHLLWWWAGAGRDIKNTLRGWAFLFFFFGVFPTFLTFFGCLIFQCMCLFAFTSVLLAIQSSGNKHALQFLRRLLQPKLLFIWWAIVKICKSGNHNFSSPSYPIFSISKSTVHGLQIQLSQPSISLSPPPMQLMCPVHAKSLNAIMFAMVLEDLPTKVYILSSFGPTQ